jgi:hypothetical protein
MLEDIMRPLVMTALFRTLLVTSALGVTPAAADPCATLSSLVLPDVTSITATPVAANSFTPPGLATPVPVDFCRAQITVTPAIKIEVWLPPAANWNHRFQAEGGGGYAGVISYSALVMAVTGDAQTGQFATASTDTGHPSTGTANGQGGANGAKAGGGFALDPATLTLAEDLITDFASRSVHEMTVKAKAVIEAYYGQPATYSYLNGCSTGGRQGWMEAQQFPDDYDGILAGAPAINWDRFLPAELWPQVVMNLEVGGPIKQTKLSAVNAAAVAACDGLDGVVDGVISDPRECHFDPSAQQCGAPGAPTDPNVCLTAAEADAVGKIWQGPRDVNGEFLWYGLEPGAPFAGLANSTAATPPLAAPFPVALDHFRLWIEQNPAFDWHTLTVATFASDFVESQKKFNGVIGTDNPDLSEFQRHGGKMITYHGWTDPLIFPRGTIDYYRRVIAANQGFKHVQEFARLFMVPGMNHCSGGVGPVNFGQSGVAPVSLDKEHDAILALQAWVEHGVAPDKIIGSHVDASGKVTFTRPLCPYPEEAIYTGQGDPNDAANFVCLVRHAGQLLKGDDRGD